MQLNRGLLLAAGLAAARWPFGWMEGDLLEETPGADRCRLRSYHRQCLSVSSFGRRWTDSRPGH